MAELHEYECPLCGGALEFDIGLQQLKCLYCDSIFSVDEARLAANVNKMDAQANMNNWSQEEQDNLVTYSCNSCGGEIITDISTGATKCPYCNNPVVMTGKFAGSLRPDYIIPFKMDKKSAIEALKNHYKKRPFLPNVFKDQNKLQEIKGMYVPFWLFSGKINADVVFKAEKNRHWSDYNYNYTEISVYNEAVNGSMIYKQIPVDASVKMPDDLMDSLEPFDMKSVEKFNTAYMAGYLANKFDVDTDKCFERANMRMRYSTINSIAGTLNGYNRVSAIKSDVQFSDIKAEYALFPVWMLVTKWQNKLFAFFMNGQTGKFLGELPIDHGKKWMTFLLIFLVTIPIIAAIFILIYFFGG